MWECSGFVFVMCGVGLFAFWLMVRGWFGGFGCFFDFFVRPFVLVKFGEVFLCWARVGRCLLSFVGCVLVWGWDSVFLEFSSFCFWSWTFALGSLFCCFVFGGSSLLYL